MRRGNSLMASIEGKEECRNFVLPSRTKRFVGKPTNINNVETYASVAWIINNGFETYAALGTEKARELKFLH